VEKKRLPIGANAVRFRDEGDGHLTVYVRGSGTGFLDECADRLRRDVAADLSLTRTGTGYAEVFCAIRREDASRFATRFPRRCPVSPSETSKKTIFIATRKPIQVDRCRHVPSLIVAYSLATPDNITPGHAKVECRMGVGVDGAMGTLPDDLRDLSVSELAGVGIRFLSRLLADCGIQPVSKPSKWIGVPADPIQVLAAREVALLHGIARGLRRVDFPAFLEPFVRTATPASRRQTRHSILGKLRDAGLVEEREGKSELNLTAKGQQALVFFLDAGRVPKAALAFCISQNPMTPPIGNPRTSPTPDPDLTTRATTSLHCRTRSSSIRPGRRVASPFRIRRHRPSRAVHHAPTLASRTPWPDIGIRPSQILNSSRDARRRACLAGRRGREPP
jgi:hypothetical protein